MGGAGLLAVNDLVPYELSHLCTQGIEVVRAFLAMKFINQYMSHIVSNIA